MWARSRCSPGAADAVCEVEVGDDGVLTDLDTPARSTPGGPRVSEELYQKELLRLAGDAHGAGRLTPPWLHRAFGERHVRRQRDLRCAA